MEKDGKMNVLTSVYEASKAPSAGGVKQNEEKDSAAAVVSELFSSIYALCNGLSLEMYR